MTASTCTSCPASRIVTISTVWQKSGELLHVLIREVAVFASHDQRGASQLAPFGPVVTSSEIPYAVDHHLLLKSRPQAAVAVVEAVGPRLGRQSLGSKELVGGVDVGERDRPLIKPIGDVFGQARRRP